MPGTILIADDHESSRAGLEALLSLEGYNVLTAEDGIEALAGCGKSLNRDDSPPQGLKPSLILHDLRGAKAPLYHSAAGFRDFFRSLLEQFRRTQPDLLLLDINMPNMRGTEVCRRIKNNPETLLVPVVLITGLTATEDRVTGIQAGADDFLCKPVDREQLIARVRSLLRQKAFTDELERAEAVLFALARSIEEKDPYTEGHCARVVTIVDVYDALTTERPYKEALGEDQALAVMKKEVKKGWWDPRLFDAFHEMMQIKLPDNLAAQAAAAAAD